MVTCILCPKKGGAMKPTNIFTSVDNYKKYNNNNSSSKKQVKKHHHNINKCASEPHMPTDLFERKIILGENEDKNLSLGVILKREFDFQSDKRELIDRQKANGLIVENEIELHFD